MLKQIKLNLLNLAIIDDLTGKWYEIARSANRFEVGMSDVRIFLEVINEKTADIIFVGAKRNGVFYRQYRLSVFFDTTNFKIRNFSIRNKFKIINIDKKSKTIMISDKKNKRFWIFTQTLPIEKKSVNQMIEEAKKKGVNVNKLIFTQLE